MDYAGRLAKLEKLAGKGDCPLCRYTRAHRWLDLAKAEPEPDPALSAVAKCELCGSPVRHDLSRYPEDERELWRLCVESTLDDYCTDARVWAAEFWRAARREAARARKRSREALARRSSRRSYYPSTPDPQKRQQEALKTPDGKVYARLREAYAGAVARLIRQCRKRHANWNDPFPELKASLTAGKHEGWDHLHQGQPYKNQVRVPFELEMEARAWFGCVEVEKYLLAGRVTETTREALDECERRALELIEEGRREYEAQEEKRRAEAERRRQEAEERARQKAEEEARRMPAQGSPPRLDAPRIPAPPAGTPPGRVSPDDIEAWARRVKEIQEERTGVPTIPDPTRGLVIRPDGSISVKTEVEPRVADPHPYASRYRRYKPE